MPVDGARRLDEELKKKVTKNIQIRRKLLDKLQPRELLQYMPCVYIATKQAILQEDMNYGKRRATAKFLDDVHAYSGWGEEFLYALHMTGHDSLAKDLYPGYQPPSDDDNGGSDHGSGGNGGSHGNNSPSSSRPQNAHRSSKQKDDPPSYMEAMTEPIPERLLGGRVHYEDQITKRRLYNIRRSETDDLVTRVEGHTSSGHQSPARPEDLRQALPTAQVENFANVAMPAADHDLNNHPGRTSQEPNNLQREINSHSGDYNKNALDQTHSSSSSFDFKSQSSKSDKNISKTVDDIQQSESNSMDRILREYQTNDLSSTQTSNDSLLSSYNETTSCNNPAQTSSSSDTVAECKNYNSEQPDPSILKEEQLSVQHSCNSYFHPVSVDFSTDISKERTSNDILCSTDDTPSENIAAPRESDNASPHSPILISDVNQDKNLINLRSDAEIKSPGETAAGNQASSSSTSHDPFSICNSNNETNTSETESNQLKTGKSTGSEEESGNKESKHSSIIAQREITSSSSQLSINQNAEVNSAEDVTDDCEDVVAEAESEKKDGEVQSAPAPSRLSFLTSLGNVVSSLSELHDKYSHCF